MSIAKILLRYLLLLLHPEVPKSLFIFLLGSVAWPKVDKLPIKHQILIGTTQPGVDPKAQPLNFPPISNMLVVAKPRVRQKDCISLGFVVARTSASGS
jgi:hypothetical protein